MAGGQWEVVGGKAKKKSKVPVLKTTKPESVKENITSNYQLSAPLSESTTIYNAFVEKEPSKEKKVNNEPPKQSQKNVQKKKKVEKKVAGPKLKIEEAFKSVNVDEMKNHIATLEALCSDSPLLWLKELASFLNVKLGDSLTDPSFAHTPTGYPCTLMHKGLYKEIVKILHRCTPQMMNVFYEFCLTALVQDMLKKGTNDMGYRVMLQAVSQEFPVVVLDSIPKCVDLIKNHVNRPVICTSIMWAAGQAGNKSLESGFKVFSLVMSPLLSNKNCSDYIVAYLENLVVRGKEKTATNLLSLQDFFPFLDLVYSKEFSKSQYQKQMHSLLPALKMFSYGSNPETTLRSFFPSYLRRLEPQCSPALRDEIFNSLISCLETDPVCFSVWREMYSKHFVQSKLLITFINNQRGKLHPKFPKNLLRDTLSAFQVTNEEHASTRKKDTDLQECIKGIQELLAYLNKSLTKSRKWLYSALFFGLILLLLMLRHDVQKHGSFAGSKTGIFLKENGILDALAQASEKLHCFYERVRKLTEKYLPVVGSFCRTTVLPLIDSFLSALGSAVASAWGGTQNIRDTCAKNIPVLLQKVDNVFGEYGPPAKNMAKQGITFLSSQVSIVANKTIHYSQAALLSLQSSPHVTDVLLAFQTYSSLLVENIQQLSLSALAFVKSYIPAG